MVALNGSYTTVARGYQCVGVNPANLAYSNGFSMNLLSFNYGAGNNVLSLNVMNELDDATIESEAVIDSIYANSGNPDGDKYFSLEDLNYLLKDGYITTMDASIPLPILNFSFQKYAFTTSPKLFVKSGIPSGFTYFLTNGNPPDIDLSIDLPLDIMAVQETGFTYAFSKEDFSFGITAKYILGYFYSTFESLDSSYIRTNLIGSLNNEEISDDFGISGQGNFLMKQAIGGNGFGVDVGLLSKEFDNGIQFGTSVTNLFGSIKWTQDHFLRSAIEGTIEESVPEEYFLRQNEFYYYHLEINSMTLENLAEKSINEMVFKLGYKVIRVSDLKPFNLTETDSLVVIMPNNGGYLIPSSEIPLSILESLSSEPLYTDYPSIFRLGISKRYDKLCPI